MRQPVSCIISPCAYSTCYPHDCKLYRNINPGLPANCGVMTERMEYADECRVSAGTDGERLHTQTAASPRGSISGTDGEREKGDGEAGRVERRRGGLLRQSCVHGARNGGNCPDRSGKYAGYGGPSPVPVLARRDAAGWRLLILRPYSCGISGEGGGLDVVSPRTRSDQAGVRRIENGQSLHVSGK